LAHIIIIIVVFVEVFSRCVDSSIISRAHYEIDACTNRTAIQM
jgi:hypothetical protein